MICAKAFLGLPRVLAEVGGTGAWMVVLISSLHGPLIWWVVRGLLKHYPGKSLIGATEAALGPVLGPIANLTYALFFGFLMVVVLREYSDALASVFMLATPLPVLALITLSTASYLAYLGIEPLTRTAWMGGTWMLLGVGVLLAGGLVTYREPAAIFPFWGTGPAALLMWGLVKNIWGDLLLFAVIAPSFRKLADLDRVFKWTILISGTVMPVAMVVYLYVFPYPAARRIVLPLLQMSRTISLGPGVQRLESVFFLIFLAAGVIKMGAALLATSAVLSETLRIKGFRHLLVPLVVLAFHISLLPKDLSQAIAWDSFLRNFGGIATIIIPAMTWGAALLRNGTGSANASG